MPTNPAISTAPDSPITQDAQEIMSATVTFAPMLKGNVASSPSVCKFWFSPDLPTDMIPTPWDGFMRFLVNQFEVVDEHGLAITLTIDPVPPIIESPFLSHDIVILVWEKQSISLMHATRSQKIHEAAVTWGLVFPLQDQFGTITNDTDVFPNMLVVPGSPPTVEITPQTCTFALAAAEQTKIQMSWDPADASFNIVIRGKFVPVTSIRDLFDAILEGVVRIRILPSHTCHTTIGQQETFIKLIPEPSTAMIPPVPMYVLLAIHAVRAMLSVLCVPVGIEIEITWSCQ